MKKAAEQGIARLTAAEITFFRRCLSIFLHQEYRLLCLPSAAGSLLPIFAIS